MTGFEFQRDKELTLLCLGAHCDDIEIGCGGTLLKIFEQYKIKHVEWVVFASNEVRKKEATRSAEMFLENIPSKNIVIKEYRDGFLPYLATEVKDFFESIKRNVNPDVVFTHYRNDRHQDHRLVSDLAWNTWRNHLILEYEIPKYDGDLGIPNFFVPLDDKYLKRRNEILMTAFESQREKHWFDDETFSALPRLRGMECAAKFAEAFYGRKIIL